MDVSFEKEISIIPYSPSSCEELEKKERAKDCFFGRHGDYLIVFRYESDLIAFLHGDLPTLNYQHLKDRHRQILREINSRIYGQARTL